MIAAISYGRLGNQLFQLAQIEVQRSSNEVAVVFGADAAKELLDLRRMGVHAIGTSRVGKALLEKIKRRLPVKTSHGPWCGVLADEDGSEGRLARASSRNLLLNGYFQWEPLHSEIGALWKAVRPELVQHARDIMNDLAPRARTPVFIHIRRGDYRTWPSTQEPAMLPDAWYQERVEEIKEKIAHPTFFVFSDEEVRSSWLPGVEFQQIHASAPISLLMMSMCPAGVLSASSLSWWAAAFGAMQLNPPSYYVAPRFWIGHRRATWFPVEIETSFLTYKD